MNIIIRRLPEATTSDELIEFATEALKPKWYFFEFFPLGHISNCKIYKVSDGNNNVIGYHGLIQVESEARDDVVVERLNASQFNRKHIDAGLYCTRSKGNERRMKREMLTNTLPLNQRNADNKSVGSHLEHLHT